MMAVAGAIVTIDRTGQEKIYRGLIRAEDRQAAQAVQGEDDTARGSVSLPQANTRPVHSERLVRQLTGNKVGITAAVLASKPGVALAVLVARLAAQVLDLNGGCGVYSNLGIGIRLDQENLDHHAPDFAASKAGQELARLRQRWLDVIPNAEGSGQWAVLDWAMNQHTDILLDLLGYLVAASVQGVSHQEPTRASDLDRLANIAGVVPAQWWEPTADSYLSHVSKDRIITVVTDVAGEKAAAPLAKMKKAQAIEAAEQALRGRNWTPVALHIRAS